MELPLEPCWEADDVTRVISTEALEGHEGVFLATHTPIEGFSVPIDHAGEIASPSERAVLTALAAPVRRHAFCVVQGEPGSGKSHLIRWLYVNWPHGNDVKLLLQRADGSLEGALNQLRKRLPGEFHDLFDRLGRRQKVSPQGRANLFLSHLATALAPGHFDPPLEDEEWCRVNRPDELVGSPDVKRGWKGPERVLRLMEGRGSNDGNARNSQSASFDLFDAEQLAECVESRNGLSGPAAKLAKRLWDESDDVIRPYREEGWSAEDIARDDELAGKVPVSRKLIEVLNRRRNDAVQNLLGVSAQGLKDLFRQVREALARRGQRLVLLLEDITSWEGIDDSLIDALVTNAETRDATGEADLCPLISVVGVTPTYYDQLLKAGNYRARITHELSLGDAREGGLQDVATLRHRETRLAFVARYLSAVRAGPARLDEWRELLRDRSDLAAPNRCDNCQLRVDCHRTFGAAHGVGLFPFTDAALDHFFDALDERDAGMTWKTPRGVLQAVLNPVLGQGRELASGNFPTARIETRGLTRESRGLAPRLERIVEARFDDEGERARAKRVLAYWGDRQRADTTMLPDGTLAFAQVPRGVFEAFRLRWIGDEEASEQRPRPIVAVPEPPAPASAPEPEPRPSPPITITQAPATPRPPPSRRNTPTRPELQRLRDQLRAWSAGDSLASPTEWNARVHGLIAMLDPRRIGLDPHTFSRVVTAQQVKIEGTGPIQRTYLMVPNAKWVHAGLEAEFALRLDGSMSQADAEFHRRALAVMMRRFEALAGDYADARLSRLNGGRWSPVPAYVQVLAARAWLRGAALPDDAPASQLRAILSDEREAVSEPGARSKPWVDFLGATKDWHERLRLGLREMLSTPQGESKGFGLADVSQAAGAILRLAATLRFDPVPDEKVETGVKEFDQVSKLVRDAAGSGLVSLASTEGKQVRDRAQAVRENLRGRSISAHIARIDAIVEAVSKELPNSAPAKVKEWKDARERAKPRLAAKADTVVEEFLVALGTGSEGAPNGPAAALGQLVRAPVGDLETFRTLTQIGESTVAELLPHVRETIARGNGTVSLDQIAAVGRAFREALRDRQTEPA